MTNNPSYKELLEHFKEVSELKLSNLFKNDSLRAKKLSLYYDGLFFDFSKNNITSDTLSLLIKLGEESNLHKSIEDVFNGNKINNTEDKSVLHTALRSGCHNDVIVDGNNIAIDVQSVLGRMKVFCDRVRNSEHRGYTGQNITDIVNIGIGGSDLGPILACEALKPYKGNLKVHFVSSVDGYHILDILSELKAETTLFIIASKTFSTVETMVNANAAKKWFLDSAKDDSYIKHHFVATSANKKAVKLFGIEENNIFEFWDFVGGRYSIFSAVGLSIMLYIGYDSFIQMLAGAHSMDDHFRNTKDFRNNIPVLLGLISIWYVNFYNYNTHVISPYNTRLSLFSAYVQQLEMESNGKSINKAGEVINYKTSPIIWGGSGINGQHAYYQLLHQGTSICPMDIIIALSDKFSIASHNDILVANAFAQAEALMNGKSYHAARLELTNSGFPLDKAEFLAKHKVFEGNRPTNIILLPEISPYYFGMLISLYEHKTYVQGIVWNINSFDQMGVELGKQLADIIIGDIKNKNVGNHDSSTMNLIGHYLNYNESQ